MRRQIRKRLNDTPTICLMSRFLIDLNSSLKSHYTFFHMFLGESIQSEGHEVCFVGSARSIEKLTGIHQDLAGSNVMIREEFMRGSVVSDPMSEALELEAIYGEYLSLVMSFERGLGKGYISNAGNHPDSLVATLSHVDKLRLSVKEFRYWESVFDRFIPDFVIGPFISKSCAIVARSRNIKTYALLDARHGSKYHWTDDEYLTNSSFTAILERLIKEDIPPTTEEMLKPYEQVVYPIGTHKAVDYGFQYAYRNSLKRIGRDLYNNVLLNMSDLKHGRLPRLIRGKVHHKSSQWIRPILERPRSYRYVSSVGKRPSDLSGYDLVYVPLHLEPEVALLGASPEFNNSLEMIVWISKSLPVNCAVIVKEQPLSFGIRGTGFYKALQKIGNVFLAHPDVHPWDWIKASKIVGTITGTTAYEAIAFGKPVISYGLHQAINFLPTVRLVSDYLSTKVAIRELMTLDPANEMFRKSTYWLAQAQDETSFPLPDFEEMSGPQISRKKMAETAFIYLNKKISEEV